MITQWLAELGNYKSRKFLEKEDKIISDVDFQGFFTLFKHLVQYVRSVCSHIVTNTKTNVQSNIIQLQAYMATSQFFSEHP